jgi:hypothetical protein
VIPDTTTGLGAQGTGTVVLLGFLILASISFVRAWFIQWTTELAITDRRGNLQDWIHQEKHLSCEADHP